METVFKRDYSTRLEKLRQRRYDDVLHKAFLSEDFSKPAVPETVKYVFESMKEIDDEYTSNTYAQAARVQNQILKGLPEGVNVEFNYQGSVPLKTHIKVHSDLDILVMHKAFSIVEHDSQIVVRYSGSPKDDLKLLRSNIYNTLDAKFPEAKVDNSKGKAVGISGGSLTRKFDVLACSWYNTWEYHATNAKHERGIYLFDKNEDVCNTDSTFKHMYLVDAKDLQSLVGGRYKSLIRLLKTLKADAEPRIELSSFMITSIMYHMSDWQYYEQGPPTKLLVSASQHLKRIITDESYRLSLNSPTGHEKLFKANDEKVLREVRRLKKELDEVIVDLAIELKKVSYLITESRSFSSPREMALPEAYKILENASGITGFSY